MATYYISPTGNDTTGDGSSGNPWATIGKYESSAINGDTLIMKDGTYTLTANLSLTINGTIQAENTGMAIISGGGAAYKITCSISGTHNLTGIVFDNFVHSSSSDKIINGYLASSLNITSCTFRNITLKSDYPSSNIIGLPTGGVNAYTTFSSCKFYNISGTAGTTYLVFINSDANKDAYISLYNNVFYGLKYIFNGTNNNEVYTVIQKNNIFYYQNTDTPVIHSGFKTGEVNFISSAFNNNCTYSSSGWSNVPTGTGNITSDPLFVDAANSNFNLQPSSPCFDTGVAV